jgi:hypothetical protein
LTLFSRFDILQEITARECLSAPISRSTDMLDNRSRTPRMAGETAFRNLHGDPRWIAARTDYVLPAFKACESHIAERGRKAVVADQVEGIRPHIAVHWEGMGQLAGIRVGLQCMFDDAGWLDFAVGLVRTKGRCHDYSQLMREQVLANDPEGALKVMNVSFVGVGVIDATERAPFQQAQWRAGTPRPKWLS